MVTLEIQIDDADYATLLDAMERSNMDITHAVRRTTPGMTAEARVIALLKSTLAPIIRGHRIITAKEAVKESDVAPVTIIAEKK